LDDLQERTIKPGHIWVGPEQEQDMFLFQNYSLFNTQLDYPASWGVGAVHQSWLPGAKPVPIPEH
jgi:hypothetical protein